MADALLTQQDRQEAFSCAYAHAIAASAGYTTSKPEIDRDSIDLTISAGGNMRPRLDLQLKATINLKRIDDEFRFSLPIKNYNDLRLPTQAPRILVVLKMPRKEKYWLNVSRARLVLRNCAFWVSLRGHPERDNDDSVTVRIPVSNVFDVDKLKELMEQSRHGVIT